jgi:hypothetical protein
LRDGQTLGAHGAVADGGIGVPLYLDHLTVFHMSDHAASPMAAPAACSDFFYFSHSSTPLHFCFIVSTFMAHTAA